MVLLGLFIYSFFLKTSENIYVEILNNKASDRIAKVVAYIHKIRHFAADCMSSF